MSRNIKISAIENEIGQLDVRLYLLAVLRLVQELQDAEAGAEPAKTTGAEEARSA